MPKITPLLIFVIVSYFLFFVGGILWIVSFWMRALIIPVYLILIAASIVSFVGTFKASKLLKSYFTKEQIRLIMMSFTVFIATIIIVVVTVLALQFHYPN